MPRPPAAAAPRSPSDRDGADEASRRNRFTGLALDRCDQRRGDAGWLSGAWRRGRLLIVDFEGRLACAAGGQGPLPLAGTDIAAELPDDASFLGCVDDDPWFALPLQADTALPAGVEWLGLREVAAGWPAFDSGMFAYAKALLLWQTRARYCGACGAPTQRLRAGHSCRCSNADCRLEQYPRTDAAIIVLVTDGERALLGRQAGWPPRRYSTLAGFVEPGESLEDTVRREVFEEAGIRVGSCRYHSSQPWPFPASLMVGFRAEAASTEIHVDDELEHALWITPQALLDAVAAKEILMPSRISISYRLIVDWLLESLPAERIEKGLGLRA